MDSDIKQLRPQQMPSANSNGLVQGPGRASPNSVHHRGPETSDDGAFSPVTTDKVTVTGEASQLQKLEQSLTNTSTVDSARVAELKQAIANGSYQPNAESIADKLAQLEQDLL